MRVFNSVDFVGQNLILGPLFLVGSFNLFTGHVKDVEWLLISSSLLIGVWQFCSSAITVFAKESFYRLRVIHFTCSIAYFLAIAFLKISAQQIYDSDVLDVIILIFIAIPLVLCLFYYYITLKTFRRLRMKKKSYMKALNAIDLAGQTIIMGWMLFGQLFGLITFQFDMIAASALYGAMFIGPWQMSSSFLTVVSKRRFLKGRIIHLVTASVYLLLINTIPNFFRNIGELAEIIAKTLIVAIPAILAIFYYVITVRTFMSLMTHKSLKHFFVKYFHNFLKV